MSCVVLWDDEEDRDFSQVCPEHELELFLKELPDLYNDAKNIRVYALDVLNVMTESLKPCPFCGGGAKNSSRYIGYGSVGLGSHDLHFVICKDCEAKSKEYKDKNNAISAWNCRYEQL